MFIASMYNSNVDGQLVVLNASDRTSAIEMLKARLEDGESLVEHDGGLFVTYDEYEPDYDEVRNCYAIYLGEVLADGTCPDAVCW